MEEKQKQLLLELATTILIVIFYWITMQPDWKLQMYLRMATAKLQSVRPVSHGLSLEHKEILRKFRQEISDWEHENGC